MSAGGLGGQVVDPLELGITNDCEPPGVDAGDQTGVLWKSSTSSYILKKKTYFVCACVCVCSAGMPVYHRPRRGHERVLGPL